MATCLGNGRSGRHLLVLASLLIRLLEACSRSDQGRTLTWHGPRQRGRRSLRKLLRAVVARLLGRNPRAKNTSHTVSLHTALGILAPVLPGRVCETDHMSAPQQFAALAGIHELLEGQGIEYWLFGGWAVDFHAGSVTRRHEDLDIAVWEEDHVRVAALLRADGWRHAPEAGEDGYTGYRRDGVKLEVAFVARSETGQVYTPLGGGGRGEWPDGAFGDDVAELAGVSARVVNLSALRADKAAGHDDPIVAAKDHADLQTLARIDSR
jgi:Aminoglycoside-2''-adenylyltransferase